MGSLKKFPMSVALWVGRRKEPILSSVPKNDKKTNPGTNGLNQSDWDDDMLVKLFNPLVSEFIFSMFFVRKEKIFYWENFLIRKFGIIFV